MSIVGWLIGYSGASTSLVVHAAPMCMNSVAGWWSSGQTEVLFVIIVQWITCD